MLVNLPWQFNVLKGRTSSVELVDDIKVVPVFGAEKYASTTLPHLNLKLHLPTALIRIAIAILITMHSWYPVHKLSQYHML